MYNGIGLATPRGSGTNGYVQRSLATLKYQRGPDDAAFKRPEFIKPALRVADESILQHKKRRKIYAAILVKKKELEQANVPEAEIQKQLEQLSTSLEARGDSSRGDASNEIMDTHEQAKAKEERLFRIASAFKIVDSDFKASKTHSVEEPLDNAKQDSRVNGFKKLHEGQSSGNSNKNLTNVETRNDQTQMVNKKDHKHFGTRDASNVNDSRRNRNGYNSKRDHRAVDPVSDYRSSDSRRDYRTSNSTKDRRANDSTKDHRECREKKLRKEHRDSRQSSKG